MKTWILQTLRRAAWAPLAVLLFYTVGTMGFHWYIIYPDLDMPTHFAGGIAMTYFYITAINYSKPLVGAIPNIIQLILAFTLTAFTAVMWEFLEKLVELWFGSKLNLSANDTLSDLFMGIMGALFTVLVVWYYRKRHDA